MAKQSKATAIADPRPGLDRARPAGRTRRHVALGARQAQPASTPPPSTNPSASPADGRERWPSTELVSKALAATNSSIDTFVQLIGDGARGAQSVPLLGLAQAGAAAISTTAAFPPARAGTRWRCRRLSDEHAYALEISGDSMKPAYRDGDIIVVSPGTAIRRGDRVVVKTTRRRGDGQGTEAPHRQDARTAVAQSGPCRPHAGCRRRRVDRADRVGEPVARFIATEPCRPGERRHRMTTRRH